MQQLIVGADNDVELPDLQDTVDHSYPQTATVSFTLYDDAGQPMTGATAVSMPFAPDDNGPGGVYRGVIPHTVALVVNASYTLRVSATDPYGNVRPFKVLCGAIEG
jgi:hypothetical protein